MRSHHRAFTMTEMAIVLGIVGIVLGGIWVAASSAQGQLKANRVSMLVLTTMTNIKNLMDQTAGKGYGFPATPTCAAGSASADITAAAINDGTFADSSDFLTGDATYPVATPWGKGASNNFTIKANLYRACPGGTTQTFMLNLVGMPADACNKVIMGNLPQWLALGLNSLTIGTIKIAGINSKNYIASGVTQSAISALCGKYDATTQQAQSADLVALEFLYPTPLPQ